MDRSPFLTHASATRHWPLRPDARIDRVRRALLSTTDGHRHVIDLDSVARAMGLDPGALEDLRRQSLGEPATAGVTTLMARVDSIERTADGTTAAATPSR